MSTTKRPPSAVLDLFAVLARWFVGGMFIYMGFQKVIEPVEFLKLVRQYELVANPWLLNSIAAALPWFEIFCGLLLVTGIAVRGAALMLVAMLIPFTALVLKRALAIAALKKLAFCAVKFNCGCGTGEVFICHKLVENGILTALSIWLLAGFGRRLSLRYSLSALHAAPSNSTTPASPAPISAP
jgi:uncharacterized membrane protein YphA (DoxX/SURF4 family)